ncbi:MAG TPA: 3-hydroxyacyl-ACP dehydratase [Bacteroidales bacterium]|nr:3-hydroxyacyl-ACP dehydratase [Bacteroidales bacterium]HPT21384.1 3-hydroxyacyl-ACP dehydratase [Bacteroidales bacterium]
MLKDTFYTVVKTESGDDTYRADVKLNRLHEIYKAHFPGNPITPGVCLLQIVLELLSDKFNRDLRLVQAKNIKYLKVISPVENPEIEFVIKYRIENDMIFAVTNIVCGETIFTKIEATYKGL